MELNFSSVLQLISQETQASHSHVALINAVKCFLHEDWNIEIINIFREANECDNKLANVGHRLRLVLAIYNSMPAYISTVYLANLLGQTSIRLVHV